MYLQRGATKWYVILNTQVYLNLRVFGSAKKASEALYGVLNYQVR